MESTKSLYRRYQLYIIMMLYQKRLYGKYQLSYREYHFLWKIPAGQWKVPNYHMEDTNYILWWWKSPKSQHWCACLPHQMIDEANLSSVICIEWTKDSGERWKMKKVSGSEKFFFGILGSSSRSNQDSWCKTWC